MAIKSKGIPRGYDKNIVQDLINVTNAKRIYIQQAITVIQTNPLQPHALQNMKNAQICYGVISAYTQSGTLEKTSNIQVSTNQVGQCKDKISLKP